MNKAIVWAMFIASTLLVEWKEKVEPSWCNEVQERIVKRVEDMRKYDKWTLLKQCVDGTMRFMELGADYWFVITPDGLTRICKSAINWVLCVEPKEEEEAIKALKKIYWKNKVEI